MTTPFDDPQAELAWMFVQILAGDGDLDEGFALLSEDFTYWSNAVGGPCDKARMRRIAQWSREVGPFAFDLINCINEGENVVIEAQPDVETADGQRYDSPCVFVFETRDGLITSLREYCDTKRVAEVFGVIPD